MLTIQTARLCKFGGRPYKGLPTECSYLVSVNKPNFKGENLLASLGLINSEFDHCKVIVTGTLQRFNRCVELNVSLEKAYQIALDEEKEFIDKTKKDLGDASSKFTFINWDFYRNHKDFLFYFNIVSDLLKKEEFDCAMQKTIDQFYIRPEENFGNEFVINETKYRNMAYEF